MFTYNITDDIVDKLKANALQMGERGDENVEDLLHGLRDGSNVEEYDGFNQSIVTLETFERDQLKNKH